MKLLNFVSFTAATLLCTVVLLAPPRSYAQQCSFHRECTTGQFCSDGTCQNAEETLAREGRVFWVAQGQDGASDDNPGTKQAPWKTIARATKRGVLQPGDAVLVRSGTYREGIRPEVGGRPGRRITFAAYPGDEVIVTGADEVNEGWARSGNAWQHTWTQPLHSPRSSNPGQEMWRREMVIVDGNVLEAVYDRTRLIPGTFFVEGPPEAPKSIYVRFPNDNPPSAHHVELASRAVLFGPSDARNCIALSDGTLGHYRLIGFTFRHAANRAQRGAVCPGASGSLIEENLVEWTNGMGLNFSGSAHVVRGGETSDNGQSGIGGVCDGCLIEYNVSNRNNWKNYPYGFEVGGGKMVKSRGTVFRHHTAIGNNGPGIWLDHLNFGNAIVNSYIADNYGHGIFLELESDSNIVAGNVLVGNRYRNNNASGNGVSITASSHNLIAYNTFLGNEGSGVVVRTDSRAAARGNHIFNNLMLDNTQGVTRGIRVHEFSVQGFELEESRSTRADGNAYTYRLAEAANADNATFCYGPKPSGSGNTYTNKLPDWQITSLGGNRSLLIDDALPSIIDRSDPAEGWRLRHDSQLRGKAVALPSGWWDDTIGSFIARDLDGHMRPAEGGDIGADQLSASRAGGALTSTVAPPAIKPFSEINPDGKTFFGTLQVELFTATPGATIHYTLDGTEPSRNTAHYTAPITLEKITTVKAKAFKDGLGASATTTTEFISKLRPPQIKPEDRVAEGPVEVVITSDRPDAEIYYTVDGSKPTPQKQRYAGPFVLRTTATVKAAAYKPGLRSSNAQVADFVVNAPAAVHRIDLQKGWNLVSAPVRPSDPRLASILTGVESAVAVVKNGSGQTYRPVLGTGDLISWDASEAYAVYAHEAVSFIVEGEPVSPAAVPIPLQKGWNLVPYLGYIPALAKTALTSLGSSLVLVKDDGGRIYHSSYGIDTLGEMRPGKGYWIYVSGTAELTYSNR